jgi:hypothetical protein
MRGRLGMKKDVSSLADPVNPDDPTDPKWIPAWKEQIDVVLDIAGDCWARIALKWHEIETIFGIHTHHASVKVVIKVKGNVRPGPEKGHEHCTSSILPHNFRPAHYMLLVGFADGISQPPVDGFGGEPIDGQKPVSRDVILIGDAAIKEGVPAWARDSTFLAFRHLEQLVPEFHLFLKQRAIVHPGLSPEEGSELLGYAHFKLVRIPRVDLDAVELAWLVAGSQVPPSTLLQPRMIR